MLVLSELKPGELVYDLGSGDGRIVIMAAQEFGARGVGVELR
nr:RNA methyltransferase [Candidatus Bathyarchaeota archaeon]